MTREGAERSLASEEVAAAIRVIDMEEVLVARIACEGHILASSEKILVLRLSISYIGCQRRSDEGADLTHGHSFNDKIYVTQIFKFRAGGKSFPNLCRFVLGYALFAHIFCEEFVWHSLDSHFSSPADHPYPQNSILYQLMPEMNL
jgi:hypothetical protein